MRSAAFSQQAQKLKLDNKAASQKEPGSLDGPPRAASLPRPNQACKKTPSALLIGQKCVAETIRIFAETLRGVRPTADS
jgi:hypothetical protein